MASMTNANISKSSDTYQELSAFLTDWDQKYVESINSIQLFTGQELLNEAQKIHFVKLVYHLYRHSCQEIFWYLGNHAPNRQVKQTVLDNIAEEMGGDGCSHEQMYLDFAMDVGIDLKTEYFLNDSYPPFVSAYKRGWIELLQSTDSTGMACLLSACERLDNPDYMALTKVVNTFQLPKKSLTFFTVHSEAKHFELVEPVLLPLWQQDQNGVKEVFNFVFEYELKMRQQLSDAVCNL